MCQRGASNYRQRLPFVFAVGCYTPNLAKSQVRREDVLLLRPVAHLMVRVPVGAGNFSLHRVQNGSGAHPSSCPMGTRVSFPGGKAAGA
jgi:hypothetical protein